MTRLSLALLALVLLGLAGCADASSGNPRPTNPAGSGQAATTSPTSSADAAAKLAAIDPCTLLSQAELDQYGLRKQGSGDVAGARTCEWNRRASAIDGSGGFSVSPAIWDHQGVKDMNTDGYSVTTVVVGKRQARQAKQIGGIGCFVAIGVTDSSRVDVIVSGDPEQACGLARQFAEFIEPRLPGGGG